MEENSVGLPSEKKKEKPIRPLQIAKNVCVLFVSENQPNFEIPSDPVASIHHKEEESNEILMDLDNDVETIDLEALQAD